LSLPAPATLALHDALPIFTLAAQTPPKAAPPVTPSKNGPNWKPVRPSLPDTITLHSNVECSHPGDFSIPLEIYVPKSGGPFPARSQEHTSELQSPDHLVCR